MRVVVGKVLYSSPEGGSDTPTSVARHTCWRSLDYQKVYRGLPHDQWLDGYNALLRPSSAVAQECADEHREMVLADAKKRGVHPSQVVAEFEHTAAQLGLPSATGKAPSTAGVGRVDASGRITLGRLPTTSPVPLGADERIAATPAAERRGRMPVIMTVHGGSNALADCMAGLVERNVRALKTGRVPFASAVNLPQRPGDRTWYDAVTAMADGKTSAGTIAAWRAAEEQIKGRPAKLAIVNGIPAVALTGTDGRSIVGVIPPTGGRVQPVSVAGFEGAVGALGSERRQYEDDEGPVQETMLLTLDDDYALPVREINTAIARHNAVRIRQKNLPPLYASGVRYKTEGSPELWWDYEEILRNGHDDCEGLAAARVGDILAFEPGKSADVYTRYISAPGGRGRLFHAICRVWNPKTGRFEYDDPSVNVGQTPEQARREGPLDTYGWPRVFVPGGGMPVPAWYRQYMAECRREEKPL